MEKLKGLITIVISILITMGFAQSTDWYKLEKKKFGFKIEFPKKPKTKTLKANKDSQAFFNKTNQFFCFTSGDKEENFAYFLYYTQYPNSSYNSDFINNDTLQNLYKKIIDDELYYYNEKLLSKRLLSENTVMLKRYTGKEIKISFVDNGSKGTLTIRMFLIKDNFYMMETVTYGKNDFNPSMKRFFDSFDLLYL